MDKIEQDSQLKTELEKFYELTRILSIEHNIGEANHLLYEEFTSCRFYIESGALSLRELVDLVENRVCRRLPTLKIPATHTLKAEKFNYRPAM